MDSIQSDIPAHLLATIFDHSPDILHESQPIDTDNSCDNAKVRGCSINRQPWTRRGGQTQSREVIKGIRSAIVADTAFLATIMIGLLGQGHVLREDVPGTGKTLTARSFATALGLEFSRVQFTPDLLPSDVTGTNIYNEADGSFEFSHGPIFANIVLADEINRAPPKTQAALLEAMGENQVTVDGESYDLPDSFFVIRTQNPVEQEGASRLPEAQVDRFMVKTEMGYPDRDGEVELLKRREQRNTQTRLIVWLGWYGLRMESCPMSATIFPDSGGILVDNAEATTGRTTNLFGRSEEADTMSEQGDERGPDPSWTLETNGNVRAAPTVREETVYVGSHDGHIYAVDTETGHEHWCFDIGRRVEGLSAVVKDTIYVGSQADGLYAIDTTDGTLRWHFDTGKKVPKAPTVAKGTVYAGNTDSHLYAIDAAAGTERWRFETDARIYCSPTVVDGVVYVGSDDGTLYAIDAATGTEQFRFQTPEREVEEPIHRQIQFSPTVVDGTVYAGTAENRLYALDAASGRERWQFRTSSEIRGSPRVADGTVYVGNLDGTLYAVNLVIGAAEWTFETDSRGNASPVVVDGLVYVAGGEHLYALDAADGTERWALKTGDSINSSPVVAGGVLYVGSDDGRL